MIEAFPPGLLLIAGAVLVPLLRGSARTTLLLALPVLTLWLVWSLPEGGAVQAHFLGWEIHPVRVDALTRVFATVFSIMAFAGALFAYRNASTLELSAAFAYAGSAIGAVFAGDLLTLFVFWELMAITSALVIWAAGTPESYRAGMRYLAIHLLGGVVLMVGIIGYVNATGSTEFTALTHQGVARWLILAGFLVNAGAPPLSAWIGDAYPEGSPSGTVFLSAFTTKTAVYTLIRGFPGETVLLFFGLYMVFYGIIYALLENDMRRILAYSIVNQVGFMVTAVGIGTPLALNGAASHAFAHIIYKALLLMSAGSVLHQTGERKCSNLGGLFQSMPITTVCGTIGALAISAFPLTSGFVTKSMINSAAAEEHLIVPWFLLVAASAGVFLHAGIKFPWFVFFQKDSGLRPPDPPANMRWAMYLFAFLCVGIGVYPQPLYAILPYPVDYAAYTGGHLVTQLQLLLFAGLAFFVMLPMMKRTNTITLDVDWLYRRLGPAMVRTAVRVWDATQGAVAAGTMSSVRAAIRWLEHHYGPPGTLARTWPTGSMVMWVAILLSAYLILDFVF
jgi:multicomponent Na+:H+ antiporter subunit D